MSYLLRMAEREETRSLTDRCRNTRGSYPDHQVVGENIPCLLRAVSMRGSSEVDVLNVDEIAVPVSALRVPASADFERGDVVEMTRSDDSVAAGKFYTVRSVNADTWVTTRLLTLTEDQS